MKIKSNMKLEFNASLLFFMYPEYNQAKKSMEFFEQNDVNIIKMCLSEMLYKI